MQSTPIVGNHRLKLATFSNKCQDKTNRPFNQLQLTYPILRRFLPGFQWLGVPEMQLW